MKILRFGVAMCAFFASSITRLSCAVGRLFVPATKPVAVVRVGTGNVGLSNLGNTCYMNSGLQAIFHANLLKAGIEAASTDIEKLPEDKPARSFLNLLRAYNKAPNGTTFAEKELLNKFYGHVCTSMPSIKGQQEDAAEFLLRFMNFFEYPTSTDTIGIKYYGDINKLFTTGMDSHLKRTGTDSDSVTKAPYPRIDLPINGHTLKACFDSFCAQETLENGSLKHFVIKALPPVLIIVFARFAMNKRRDDATHDLYYVAQKIDQAVFFPQRLQFQGNTRFLDYWLTGIVVHGGSYTWDSRLGGSAKTSGHYWAYAKDYPVKQPNQGTWWSFNDAVATSDINKQVEDICRSGLDGYGTPYILFYQRAGDSLVPLVSETGWVVVEPGVPPPPAVAAPVAAVPPAVKAPAPTPPAALPPFPPSASPAAVAVPGAAAGAGDGAAPAVPMADKKMPTGACGILAEAYKKAADTAGKFKEYCTVIATVFEKLLSDDACKPWLNSGAVYVEAWDEALKGAGQKDNVKDMLEKVLTENGVTFVFPTDVSHGLFQQSALKTKLPMSINGFLSVLDSRFRDQIGARSKLVDAQEELLWKARTASVATFSADATANAGKAEVFVATDLAWLREYLVKLKTYADALNPDKLSQQLHEVQGKLMTLKKTVETLKSKLSVPAGAH